MPDASHLSRDIGLPLARSSLAVISETTRPAPSAEARRRNGASVTPDIGARKTRLATPIPPIFKGLSRKESKLLTGFSLFLTDACLSESILEHNSCAVKFHAYTLANSTDLASALQQIMDL